MISEYHVNLLLEKLDAIIANQEAILKAMKGSEQIVVSSVPPALEIQFQEEMKNSAILPKKNSGTGQFKEAFQIYKKRGGELPWNAWLKAGKPMLPPVP